MFNSKKNKDKEELNTELEENEEECEKTEPKKEKSILRNVKKDKRDKRKSTFWILIGVGCLIIIFLIIISSVLNIGGRLRSVSKYLEIAFYVLSVLLVYFLIINPIRIIAFAPTFSIVTTLDKNKRKNYKVYKKWAKAIVKYNDLPDKDLDLLEDGLKTKENLREALNTVLDSSIKKEINKIIIQNAKTVFISTAISQNGRLDMLTVLSVNLKMIKEIVQRAGFRPSYAKLGKLSLNVLGTSLIAENLEGLNFTDLFPTSTANYLAEIPLVKPLANSLVNGLSNGLLTLRVGIVARRYLFSETKPSKAEIRRKSIKESVKMLPLLIGEVIAFFPQKIAKLFKKTVKGEQAEPEAEA